MSNDNEPFVIRLKEKSHDYRDKPRQKGDALLKQTYFKVVEKDDKTGKLRESSMDNSQIKETIKKLTDKFTERSFGVAVFYENVGWRSVERNEQFNSGDEPILCGRLYADDDDDDGEITDFIIYTFPKMHEVT